MSVKKEDAVVATQKQGLEPKLYEQEQFKNSSHMSGVFKFLQNYRKATVLCDINLVTDDGKIVSGHKLIFMSASPYFQAMFTKFKESNKDHVNIKELDSKVLELLVDYIYTGEITITKENVQVVLPAADLLQLDYVKQACIGFFKKQLDPSNCLGIKAFSDIYNCTELLSISEEFIKNQFLKVVKYDEFLSLSSDEVIKLISRDDIFIPFEEKLFECVINWVNHEVECRKNIMSKLMDHVRLPLISKEYLLEKVVDEPLLKSSPKCKDYIFEALHFNLIKSVHPSSVPQTIRSKPRSCSLQKIVLVLSMSSSGNKLITNWYDPATNLWQSAPELSKAVTTVRLGVINYQFVFAVGETHNSHSCSVEMLDVFSEPPLCWVSMAKLLVSRNDFGVGVLDDCIYAIGGTDINYNSNYNDYYNYNYNYCTNSVEVFDINTQQWQMVSSMSNARSHFGVGVLDNLIYVVGGYNGSSYLKSVECYNPSLNEWNPVAEMSVSRYKVSVGVLNGVMYAIGGSNESVAQKTVEAYTPSTGVWKSIPNMNLARKSAEVFALNGLLYVMAGTNEDSKNSIEIYNPHTNSWSMKTLSTSHFPIYGAVVVTKPPYSKII